MSAVSLTPLLAAITATDPAPTAVTKPVAFTFATAWSALVQASGCPAITLPLESRTVALSWIVCGTTSVAVPGDTVTEPTCGAVTVIAAVALAVPMVAAIVTTPGASPVTVPSASPDGPKPVGVTVATFDALVRHVTTALGIAAPAESSTVAARMIVSPVATAPDAGASDTDLARLGLTPAYAVAKRLPVDAYIT